MKPVERLSNYRSLLLSPLYREHDERYKFARNLLPSLGCILDAGCGTGYGLGVMNFDADKIDYLGFDISAKAIKSATDHEHNGQFKQGDITQLPLDNSHVDMGICFETLEHIEFSQQIPALLEMSRVLKEGSMLLISVPSKELHVGQPNPYHIGHLQDNEWEALIQQSPFVIKTKYGQNRIYYKGYELAHSLYKYVPLLGRLLWLPQAYFRPLIHLTSIELAKPNAHYRNIIFECINNK